MRFEAKKIKRSVHNQVQKNIINNTEKRTSYNKKISSKKFNKKRKRKTYKSQSKLFIFFKFQQQQTFESFFKRSFQILLKTINIKQSNVQINQISIAKFIIRF